MAAIILATMIALLVGSFNQGGAPPGPRSHLGRPGGYWLPPGRAAGGKRAREARQPSNWGEFQFESQESPRHEVTSPSPADSGCNVHARNIKNAPSCGIAPRHIGQSAPSVMPNEALRFNQSVKHVRWKSCVQHSSVRQLV